MRTVRSTAVTLTAVLAVVAAAGAAAAHSAHAPATQAASEPAPVPDLDADRYLGTWHQLAAIPQVFEVQCKKNVKAQYTAAPSGSVGVRNSCDTWWGSSSVINGEAKPLDASNARLNVSFVKVGGAYRHGSTANYIVVGLDRDYRWAVVTNSDRTSGFLLSRTPSLSGKQQSAARDAARSAGLDPCTFKVTRQDGGAQRTGPWC